MKELITADLHIDSSRELEETIKVLNFIVEEAIKNEVQRVVVLGDIYDKKHPNSEERMVFQKWIMKLVDKGFDVLLVIGNHDEFALKTIKGERHYSFGEFEILRIDKVKVVRSGYKEEGVFYGHFVVQGAKLGDYDTGYVFDTGISVSALLKANPGCTLFLLGDIHKGQIVYKGVDEKKILYAGSLERITWGERDDRKVLLIRDGLKLRSIDTPIRKWIQIEEDWTEKQHMVDEPIKEDIEGALVKLVVKEKKGMGFVVRDDFIRERYARAHKLIITYDIVKDVAIRNKEISEAKSVTDCFLEYSKEKEYKQETVDVGLQIIKGTVD